MPHPHLIENPELSSPAEEQGSLDSRLIHGDNLPVLTALQREFRGAVQCIYVDPPYNTGNAFEQYGDSVPHDEWLAMMRDRLQLLHGFLNESGTLFMHLDGNELCYCMAVADEIFGRVNRIAIVTFKQSSVSGPKVINAGLVNTASYIVVYSRSRSRWKAAKIYVSTVRDRRYNKFIEHYEQPIDAWRLIPLNEAFARSETRDLDAFVLANAERIVRKARTSPKDIAEAARVVLGLSDQQHGRVFRAGRPGKNDMFFLDGEQLIFYSSKVREVDGQRVTAQALSTIWDDLLSNDIAREGSVTFRKGKKPERLIKRVLEIATNPGDIVLDCFAGSGTTGAVAHKMGRRWIMVEKGEHCRTHIVPRMKAVIDGTDLGGVSKVLGWNGGGGFRYFEIGSAGVSEVSASTPRPPASLKPLPAGVDLDDFLESHSLLDEEEASGRGRRRRR